MSINRKYMFSCILVAFLLCLVQVRGSTLLILGCLAVFMALLAIACGQNDTLPVLLFFLPWSPILKLDQGSFSFYTFGLVMICVISLVKKRFFLKNYALVAGFSLLFLTLVSKLLDESFLSLDYLAFLMMIVLLPVVKEEAHGETYDFYRLTVFFSTGIIMAALCAMYFASYHNIAKYIRVDSWTNVIRRSGFYGDANFYTAQITAAMGGCLMLLLQQHQKRKLTFLGILLGFLLYCGFLSGSKSFVLVAVCMLAVWLLRLVQLKGRPGLKIALLMGAVLLGAYVATSALFSDLIDVMRNRFSFNSSLDRITTGRITLWKNYVVEIFGNIKVFFLGKGYTNINVRGRASHNTILQALYQLGIAGVPFLVYWMRCFLADGIGRRSRLGENRRNILILLIGVYLPWMAIDTLFFDDFFLLQWYVYAALYRNSNDHKIQII